MKTFLTILAGGVFIMSVFGLAYAGLVVTGAVPEHYATLEYGLSFSVIAITIAAAVAIIVPRAFEALRSLRRFMK